MGTDMNGNYVNETKFDLVASGQSGERDIHNRYTHTNVAHVNPYQFMDDSYFGEGGYRTGAYLIPFSRESDYLSRKELAVYKNYLKPILDAMITPVFAQQAVRITQGNTYFDSFEEDVTGNGMPLQEFTCEVTSIARRHGVCFVVMDNYIEQPETVAQASEQRIYPYVYIRKASQVAEFHVDDFGNLDSITFNEPDSLDNDEKTCKKRRKWTAADVTTYKKEINGKWVVDTIRPIAVGRIPVITLYSDSRECVTILVDPPLYDIARMNHMIYNMTAEIRDQERSQAFSVFYCQGIPPSEMAVGTKTYLNLPDGVTITPGYASPNQAILDGLISHEDKIREQIYMIAEQNGVTGITTAKSGVALAWEFLAHEEVLRHTAAMATYLENQIAELFGDFTNESFVYNVKYRMVYSPVGIDDEIARYDKILKMPGVPVSLTNKIYERIARAVLVDEDQTVVDDVVASFDVVTRPTVVSSTDVNPQPMEAANE